MGDRLHPEVQSISPLTGVRARSAWIYSGTGLLGVLIAFYPTLLSGFTRLQADLEDTRLNNYFLEHSFQLLVNRNYNGGLWSPTFFYPAQNVLAFSDNLFGAAPIYWLFRSLATPDLAYQLWTIAISLLTFAACVWLLRSGSVGPTLSALGAFWFAFGLPRTAQLGHPQLLPQFFSPIALVIAWRFIQQPRRSRFLFLLLLLYLQTLAGVYLGWFLLVSLPVFAIAAYGLHPPLRQRLWTYLVEHWRGDGAIALLWLLGMGVTFYPYWQVARAMGPRPYLFMDLMLPRFSSWLAVMPGSLWSQGLAWSQENLPRGLVRSEHYLFAGGMVILLTGVTIGLLLVQSQKFSPHQAALVRTSLVSFLVLFGVSWRLPGVVSTAWQTLAPYYPLTLVATAYPYNLSLWSLVYFLVPAASAIRAVTRIWTVAYLYLFVAVTLGAEVGMRTLVPQRWRSPLLLLLLLVGMAEQLVLPLPSHEKAGYLQEQAELQALIQSDCDVAYVSVEGVRSPCPLTLSAMWAGLAAQVPIVNGCSGNAPVGYGGLQKTPDQVLQWLGDAPGDRLCFIYGRSQTPALSPAQLQTRRGSEHFFAVTLPRQRRESLKLPENLPNQP